MPGGFRGEPGVSWASYSAAAEPRVGEPSLRVCLRRSVRAQPWGIWGRLPRVSSAPELWQNRRWELLLPLVFLFKNKQKDFQTCLGRDRMPNGLAPSFPSCYLSCPVVWGESARRPTPTGAAGWGAGPAQLVSPVE